jgi:hypothetical protein
MHRVRTLVGSILWLTLAASAYGQSLGDVARDTRQKLSSKGDAAKKVITNEDIPESPDASSEGSEPVVNSDKPSHRTSHSSPQSPEQVKAAILEQKHRIVSLQDQIDKLNGSIYFWDVNLFSSSSAAAQHNELQMKKQRQIEYLRTQLTEQQKKLVEMQHAAMASGMGSTVYDP